MKAVADFRLGRMGKRGAISAADFVRLGGTLVVHANVARKWSALPATKPGPVAAAAAAAVAGVVVEPAEPLTIGVFRHHLSYMEGGRKRGRSMAASCYSHHHRHFASGCALLASREPAWMKAYIYEL